MTSEAAARLMRGEAMRRRPRRIRSRRGGAPLRRTVGGRRRDERRLDRRDDLPGQHLGVAGRHRRDLSRGGARVCRASLWRRYRVAGAPGHLQPDQSHRPVRHGHLAGVAAAGLGRPLSVRLCEAGAGQFQPPARPAPRHGVGGVGRAGRPTCCWRSRRRYCFTASSFCRRARPNGSPRTSSIRCRSTRHCASSTCCRCRRSMAAGSRSACCRGRSPIRLPGSSLTACRSCCCCCSCCPGSGARSASTSMSSPM